MDEVEYIRKRNRDVPIRDRQSSGHLEAHGVPDVDRLKDLGLSDVRERDVRPLLHREEA